MPKEKLIIRDFAQGLHKLNDPRDVPVAGLQEAKGFIFNRVNSIIPMPKEQQYASQPFSSITDFSIVTNNSLLFINADYNLNGEIDSDKRFLIMQCGIKGTNLIESNSDFSTNPFLPPANYTTGPGGSGGYVSWDHIGLRLTASTGVGWFEPSDNPDYGIIDHEFVAGRIYQLSFDIGPVNTYAQFEMSLELSDGTNLYNLGSIDYGTKSKRLYTDTTVTFIFEVPDDSNTYTTIRINHDSEYAYAWWLDNLVIADIDGKIVYYDIDDDESLSFIQSTGYGRIFNIDGTLRYNSFENNEDLIINYETIRHLVINHKLFKDLSGSLQAPITITGLKQFDGNLHKPEETEIYKGSDTTLEVNNEFPRTEELGTVVTSGGGTEEFESDYVNYNDAPYDKNAQSTPTTTGVEFTTFAVNNLTGLDVKKITGKVRLFTGYTDSSHAWFRPIVRVGELASGFASGDYYVNNGLYQTWSKNWTSVPVSASRGDDGTGYKEIDFEFLYDTPFTLTAGRSIGLSLTMGKIDKTGDYWFATIEDIKVYTVDTTETLDVDGDGAKFSFAVGSVTAVDYSAWNGKWKFAIANIYENNQSSPLKELSAQTDSGLIELTGPPYILFAVQNPINTAAGDRIHGCTLWCKNENDQEYRKLAFVDYLKSKMIIYPTKEEIAIRYDSTAGQYKSDYYPNEDTPPPYITFQEEYGIEPLAYSYDCAYLVGIYTNRKVYCSQVKIYDDTSDLKIDYDGLYYSLPGMPDMFHHKNKIDIVKNDGETVTAMQEFADRLLVFKPSKTYVINISKEYEFLEEVIENNGVAAQCNTCRTEFGVAWINEKGMFLYNGQDTQELLITKKESGIERKINQEWWNTYIMIDGKRQYQELVYLPFLNILMITRPASGAVNDEFNVFFHIDSNGITLSEDFFASGTSPDNYSKIVFDPKDKRHYFVYEDTGIKLAYFDEYSQVSTNAEFAFKTKEFAFAEEQGNKTFTVYTVEVYALLNNSAGTPYLDIVANSDKGTSTLNMDGDGTYKKYTLDLSADSNFKNIEKFWLSSSDSAHDFINDSYIERVVITYRRIGKYA